MRKEQKYFEILKAQDAEGNRLTNSTLNTDSEQACNIYQDKTQGSSTYLSCYSTSLLQSAKSITPTSQCAHCSGLGC